MSEPNTEIRESERKKPVTIFFGAIHTHSKDPMERYVILDVGEGDMFTSSHIIGKRLAFPGTGKRDVIDKIVGTMEIDEILKKLKRTFGSISPSMKRQIIEYSQKPSRQLS